MARKPLASAPHGENSNSGTKVRKRRMSPRGTKGRKGKGRRMTTTARSPLGGGSRNKDAARAPAAAPESSTKRGPTRPGHGQPLKSKLSLEEPDVDQLSLGSSSASSEDM